MKKVKEKQIETTAFQSKVHCSINSSIFKARWRKDQKFDKIVDVTILVNF